MQKLQAAPWPGNVRQLENLILRAAVLGSSATIGARDIALEDELSAPRAARTEERSPSGLDAALDVLFEQAARDPKLKLIAAAERLLIVRALASTHGNQVRAARLLGITRATLRKRVARYGLRFEFNVE